MTYTSRSMRRRRDTDKWEVALSHSNPLTGELETTYHTVTAKTENQARKKRDELIRKLNLHGAACANSETVRELLDDFIAHKERSGGIEQSTAHYYRKDARTINRYIGDLRLRDLTIASIDGWMTDMEADGLAPRSIAKPFRLLKQALKFAMANDLLTKNPCDYCKPPKQQRKKVNALNKAERTRMLELVRDNPTIPINLAIQFALTTGMRRGEICGLRWSDLNEDGTISVVRAIGEAKGGVYVKDPKTTGSRRTIPLLPRFYAYLKAMKADSENTAARFGFAFRDPYILGTQEPESKPYQPTRLTREFKTFRETNGFDCQFHDLRHTFATMMIASGTDVRTVASWLGHSNVSETLNTYAEADPDAKRAAVKTVQECFDIEESEMFKLSEPNAREPIYSVEELEKMLEEARRREFKRNAC